MLLFTFFAYPMGRRRDSVTSLLATVAIMCLISPESVLDIGLLLSFFATLGIILLGIPLTKRLRSLSPWIQAPLVALTITATATLFTLPFSVWYFGEWAILSPLANLLLVPIVTLLLYLAPLLLIFSPIPALAYPPALLIKGIFHLLTGVGDFFGGNDYLLLPLDFPIIGTAAMVCIVIVIPLYFFVKTRPMTLAVMLLFLAFAGIYCTIHAVALLPLRSVLPLTDGENDCLVVQAGTRSVLIDHSSGGYTFLSDAIDTAEKDPMVRVDSLLLTHYHYRQIATVSRLLEHGRLEYLILPKPAEQDRNIAETLSERALRSGCQVRWYSDEDSVIVYHGIEIHIDLLGREDHPLSTVTVYYQEDSFVYSADVTGDFSEDALQGTHRRASVTGSDPRWGKLYEFSPSA
jgi:competence protein ComEC